MRPKGISAELEQRRRDAIAMLKQGMKPTLVAKTLQTPLVSVGRWRKACRVEALKAKPEPGRPGWLLKGPIHHGFATELWPLARVAV
jgi:transposase